MKTKLIIITITILSITALLKGYAQNGDSYEQHFIDRYGTIPPYIRWNMAVNQTLVIKTNETSTITVFGSIATNLRGLKKLAVFKNIKGTQTLNFDRPFQQTILYILINKGGTSHGYFVQANDALLTIEDTYNYDDNFILSNCVTQENKDIPVDQYVLSILTEDNNNLGKVTQSSQYISDGNPIVITPVYSNCGYTNTFGIYIQEGDSIGQTLDLWTKKTNHTSGIISRPVFTITLPIGTVFGYYIKNYNGTFYSDASFNKQQARTAGMLKGDDCWYLAFEDMPYNGDMDYNDMVFKIESTNQVLDNDPCEWTIAVETDEYDSDFDFNDVVFKFSYVKGDNQILFTPLASGTNKKVDIYLNDSLLGEIHEMLNASNYDYINVNANTTPYPYTVTEYPFYVNIPELFSVSDDMGGFTVKVDNRTISHPKDGHAPQMLLISSGDWKWPSENYTIDDSYPNFPWKDYNVLNIPTKSTINDIDDYWYTMQGIKVEKPLKGIFIKQRKKVIIR